MLISVRQVGTFDSERDMADFGDEYFDLESLDNKQNALH